MPHTTNNKVSRWDQHGRGHVVWIERVGLRRRLTCETCGWRRPARFLPWIRQALEAREHLEREHQATVDPGGS
ncbi:hypothetical protein OKJ48_30425 [Streptomyces kunmingensis]|uniref:Uncharacterized protein n=1 Tax=Streptomyces kunmingensis TaxID=68225 RepID=A0ABU6CIH0_9ACTN|nr:hypothetical protein [Streptomyces kunmingensis]MEB3964514.1 hypothetical protein [Streptomyces kunmingensis]